MPRTHLLNRDFVLLWQGQLVSQLGSQALAVAMMFWTLEATGSASLMGILMVLATLPGVVLGPLAGTLADRISRKKILVLSDLVSSFSLLTLAIPFFLPGMDNRVLLPCLLAMASAVGLAQAFFRPTISAAIPDLVPHSKLNAANSLNQFSAQFSMILGMGLGGVLFTWLGAPLLFIVDGVSYLFSAISEMFIRFPKSPRSIEREQPDAIAPRSFRQDLVEGLRFVWHNRGMRGFLALAASANFFVMPIVVLLPFFVTDNLARDAVWYGFLVAGLSAGGLVGFAIAGTIRLSGERRALVLLGSLVAQSALLGVLGLLHDPTLALLLLFVQGVLGGHLSIELMTLFQLAAPEELRGRVMGVVNTAAMAVAPLGMALGGVLGDLTGKNIPMLYALCGGAIGASTIIAALSSRVRAFLATTIPEGEAASELEETM